MAGLDACQRHIARSIGNMASIRPATVGMLVAGRRVRFEPNAVDVFPDRTKPLHHPLNGAAGHAGPTLRSRLAPSAPADGGPKGSSEINQQKSVPPGAPGCS